ncbi:sugar phosphate isomerase/epimerase [soil metagenome]
MTSLNRRNFLKNTSALSAGIFLPFPKLSFFNAPERRFKISLAPSAIGVKLNQRETLQKAQEYGFEAFTASPAELAAMSSAERKEFQNEMKSKNLSWDTAGLPVQFRDTAEIFQKDLKELPRLAAALQDAGVAGTNTWIMPTHKELTYRENFKQHAERLGEVATILGDHNLKLGLEYVGPKTLMASQRFSFVRTMKELKELIAEIGKQNVGIQLDSFHWFCAEETPEDIRSLDKNEIITCDLNDAKAGRSPAEQIDSQRELPGHSGVIDLKSFIGALLDIGYDGPVRAEPFNKELNEMDDDQALAVTFKAMKNTVTNV